MLEGKFVVSGNYTNLVPGCTVLPLLDVSAIKVNLGFEGTIQITQDGKVSGTIRDSIGSARITGRRDGKRIIFRKKYFTGEMASQPPINYILDIENGTDSESLTLKGGYRFDIKQTNDDGQVIMFLNKCA
jgi:hypothetical protein